VNQKWKLHGAAMDQTILKLTDLYLNPSTGKYLIGLIIGTYHLNSYGVEISDLTLDDNYSALKEQYRTNLQLQAVFLQSNQGQHWIHHVHVINAVGELADDFPVEIGSRVQSPMKSNGNLVEYVTMDHWSGGECTAIAIANAVAEVRYNTVTGYWGDYGGWYISDVNFHDNYAIQTVYGFNIDSLQNSGVRISHNQIIHPQSYGLVIGGIGQFNNFSISDNTVIMASTGHGKTFFGLILQGNVSGARVTGNRIITDQSPPPANIFGVYEKDDHNANNVFQGNQISSSFQNSLKSANCVYGNLNQSGNSLPGLVNTQAKPCLP